MKYTNINAYAATNHSGCKAYCNQLNPETELSRRLNKIKFPGKLCLLFLASIFFINVFAQVNNGAVGQQKYSTVKANKIISAANNEFEGLIDNGFTTVDADGDGYTLAQGDCDDGNPNIHPGAVDICNGIDDNCDGRIDENAITATITPNGTVYMCIANPVILSANYAEGTSYQWLKNGRAIVGAISQTYTATEQGSYQVSELNGFGCTDISTLTVLKIPRPVITSLSGGFDLCITNPVILKRSGGIGNAFQWMRDGNPIPGERGQTCTATVAGNYSVSLTNKDGCIASSKSVYVGCLSLAAAGSPDGLSVAANEETLVYPNPSNGIVNIKYSSTFSRQMQINVFDVSGRLVFSKTTSAIKGNNNLQLDLRNLNSGSYYVELKSSNQEKKMNFIIQR